MDSISEPSLLPSQTMYLALQSMGLHFDAGNIQSTLQNPKISIPLLIFALVCINAEFLWPGHYVPGAAGLALACISLSGLARNPVSPLIVTLSLLGAASFFAEGVCNWHHVPGAVATSLWTLAIHQSGMTIGHSLCLAVPQGALLTISLSSARRSREAKRHTIKIVVDARQKSLDNGETKARASEE
jgi:membrane-bound ClpP family serine protease